MNKTRLTIVVVLALMMSTLSYAQKGSVSKAESYLSKADYANAKAEIDMAITIEKTAAKVKTWYVRGQVYEAIAKSEDMAVNSIDPDALTKTMEAYNRVFESEKESSSYYQLSKLNVDGIWGAFLNLGSVAYGEEEFIVALNNFEKALVVLPGDSTTLLYAGAAAQQADETEKTLKYYTQLIENGDASENVFSVIIFMKRKAKENDEALAVTLMAKEAYPDNKSFASEELSLLMVLNKLEEAEMKLKSAIEKDPSVVVNHLNLAVLYDNLGSKLIEEGKKEEGRAKLDLARASYKNAIDIEPDNYIANYNTGAILVNHAKEYLDEARDMDLKTYQKKGPALESEAKVILKESLPYFEIVAKVKPNDIDALSTLQSIYSQLKMYDEAEEIMNKVEELEAAQPATEGE
ncbi:MAG: hypothetical protein JXR07_09980 [Reichenbachiella sp.]